MIKIINYTLRVEVEGVGAVSEAQTAKELFEKQLRNRVINAGSTHLRVTDLNEE